MATTKTNGNSNTHQRRSNSSTSTRARSALKTAREQATAPRIGAAIGLGALAAAAGFFANAGRREQATTLARDLYSKARTRFVPEATASNENTPAVIAA
ncbi:hypothetical protein [Sphingomonas sp. ID0503]|uniref:hypothetical protein n=1 Tax=Sphingomonas sp. ID0503 TaxID=3399691 RepID=UPI003AFAE60A